MKNYSRKETICIYVDIYNYSNFCEKNTIDLKFKYDDYIYESLIKFNDIVIEKLKKYSFKNIDIQGDGVFGILEIDNNSENNWSKYDENALLCSIEICDALNSEWTDEIFCSFKIGISKYNELFVKYVNDSNENIIFAGGAVNKSKTIMKNNNLKNKVIVCDRFVNFIPNDFLHNIKCKISYDEGRYFLDKLYE